MPNINLTNHEIRFLKALLEHSLDHLTPDHEGKYYPTDSIEENNSLTETEVDNLIYKLGLRVDS